MKSAVASVAIGVGLVVPFVASAQPLNLTFTGPTLDRWVYPFNATPGYRNAISVFSALGQESLAGATFDQRDAQMLVGFDTAGPLSPAGGQVPAGLGECGYSITRCVVRVAVVTDLAFPYDSTYDAWTTYPTMANPQHVDLDPPGRPIELYGAAFRAPFTAETFFEGTSINPGPPFGPSDPPASDDRYVYATDAAGGGARDVSNNVRDEFDPKPFAIGRNAALAEGQLVPANTDFTFELNVTDPEVQLFLRRGLNEGRLRFCITSLQSAVAGGGSGGPGTGQFATFYAKENVFGSGRRARLELTVETSLLGGDVNGDGVVNGADLSVLLSTFGTQVLPGFAGDLNCDGLVNGADLSVLLSNFGRTAS